MKKYFYQLFCVVTAVFFMQVSFVSAESYPDLCSVFNRTLKIGDTGTDVRRLQVVLGQEGIAYLSATGYYGNATAAAVKIFQNRNGIYPVGKVGPQTYRFMQNLWCTGGSAGPIPTGTPPYLTPTPYPPTNFQVPEISIQPVSSLGNSVLISWNTKAMNYCSIQKDYENFQNVQTVGQQLFSLLGESRFNIKCTANNGREYSKQIVVRPNQSISNLPWVNVTISPAQAIAGQQATLSWSSQNTSYCTSNVAGYNSNLQTSGTLQIVVSSGSQNYSFTCYNQSGQSVTQTITTNSTSVSTPTINNFTYSNNYLAWGTSNVTNCTLSGGNLYGQSVQTNGNQYVATPNVNTTWTLNCYGNNNQMVTRQVNHNIYTTDTNTIVGPTTIAVGQSGTWSYPQWNGGCVSVTWGDTTSGQTNCDAPASFSHTYNHSGTFTITFNGSGGVTKTLTVVVSDSNTGVNTLVASPNSGSAPLVVNFTGSVNSGGYTLEFGDGTASYVNGGCTSGSCTSGTVSTVNTSHTYSYSGTYTAKLRRHLYVNEANCASTDCNVVATAVVTVGSSGSTAILSANPSSPSIGQSTIFTLTGNTSNYFGGRMINFGDNTSEQSINCTGGVTSCTTLVTHTYNLPGTFYVRVYGVGEGSQYTIASMYITVGTGTQGNITAVLTANPSTTSYVGQPVTLTWSSTNASYCNLSGGNINLYNQSTSGSTQVYPTANTNYSVICYGTNGQSISANVVVSINNNNSQVTNVNISANPNPISLGQITNLTWYSTGANYCNLSGGNLNVTNQSTSGSYAVSPAIATNYTITCYNNNGQSASAYVYVTTTGNTTNNTNTSLFITSNSNRNVNMNVYKAPYNSCTNGYINWGDGSANTNYTYPVVSYGSACQIGVFHQYPSSGSFTITAYENNSMVASTQITVQ